MLTLLSLLFLINSWAASNPPINSIVCFNAVSETLIRLKVQEKWKRVYSSPELSFLVSPKSNQQDFNAWLGITQDQSILIIKKEDSMLQHSFIQDDKCANRLFSLDGQLDQHFSALDFIKESIKHPKFVIVLWSPHMAISLHQLRDMKDKKFAVPIVYILDQNADQKMAKSFIDKQNMPKNTLRKWAYGGRLPSSIEHFPSTLFVKNGRIIKYVPGYNSTAGLEELIRNNL